MGASSVVKSGNGVNVCLCVRTQHRKGGWGPDRYMALVVVPEGVPFDIDRTPLQLSRLASKGIKMRWIGEYYSDHTGPRSAFSRLEVEALSMAEQIYADHSAVIRGGK
jgi:hypothetical protein